MKGDFECYFHILTSIYNDINKFNIKFQSEIKLKSLNFEFLPSASSYL